MLTNPGATLVVFAYEALTVGTHVAVLREARQWPGLVCSVATGDALIERSRSRVASGFLAGEKGPGSDVLLMVDHDISWQHGDLAYLARMAHERQAVVGGLYPKRAFGKGAAVRTGCAAERKVGSDELVEAQYLSAGFMAIPRPVLRKVADALTVTTESFWPFFLPSLVDGEFLSEDWAFCDRARQAGFPLLVALKPRLQHEGRYRFRLVDSIVSPPPDRELTLTL